MSVLLPSWFILGPTAVGKTEIALILASRISGEIVSADSMQLYRGMNIGTAKPTLEQRNGVPHHLIDSLDIHEHCDVGRFQLLAKEAIQSIRSRGRTPIIVGGSGMYVRVLTQGLFEGPGRDENIRNRLGQIDTQELRQKLERVDPISFRKIGVNDRKRIIRALEFQELTGSAISTHHQEWDKREQKQSVPTWICLMRPREELYHRSNLRVLEMIEKGWVDEVRQLQQKGLEASPTASKAIGYPEILRYLQSQISRDEMITLIQQKTRQLIKRQIIWFRKEPGLRWIEMGGSQSNDDVVDEIVRGSHLL